MRADRGQRMPGPAVVPHVARPVGHAQRHPAYGLAGLRLLGVEVGAEQVAVHARGQCGGRQVDRSGDQDHPAVGGAALAQHRLSR